MWKVNTMSLGSSTSGDRTPPDVCIPVLCTSAAQWIVQQVTLDVCAQAICNLYRKKEQNKKQLMDSKSPLLMLLYFPAMIDPK